MDEVMDGSRRKLDERSRGTMSLFVRDTDLLTLTTADRISALIAEKKVAPAENRRYYVRKSRGEW
jgi:hypothetical protein